MESLRELYTAYKDSTEYVKSWLWSNSGFNDGILVNKQPSSQDIVNAAIRFRERRIVVPSSVIASLSNAIHKRQKAGDIYLSTDKSASGQIDETDNVKHRAFIKRWVLHAV